MQQTIDLVPEKRRQRWAFVDSVVAVAVAAPTWWLLLQLLPIVAGYVRHYGDTDAV